MNSICRKLLPVVTFALLGLLPACAPSRPVPEISSALTPADFVWPSKSPTSCPFAPSRDITGIALTPRHAEYTHADTWYPSWASDDVLYSGFTDGEVDDVKAQSWKGGTEGTTGQARIVGADPLVLQITPLPLFFDNPAPYGGRYPSAYLVHNGIWYYGTYCLDDIGGPCGNWCTLGPFVGFRYSRDFGHTWTDTTLTPQNNLFGESAKNGGKIKMGAPHFVDFGKNMQHSPDGKAYLIAHGATDPDARLTWIAGDQIYLARVAPSPETINDHAAYEFFAGHDSAGRPLWTSDFHRIKPLVEWKDHCGCVTLTFNAPFRKYLLCITHGYPSVGPLDTFILEADALTGPYRLITYLEHFGPQGYFVNFPSKFISPDGRTAWLSYSANYTDDSRDPNARQFTPNPAPARYAWCLQEVRLLPSQAFRLGSHGLGASGPGPSVHRPYAGYDH